MVNNQLNTEIMCMDMTFIPCGMLTVTNDEPNQVINSRAPAALSSRAPYPYRKAKETYEFSLGYHG